MQRPLRYELYAHGADVGVRGFGADPAEAFEAVALALTSAVCPVDQVRQQQRITLHCEASTLDDLLYQWINTLVYQMAVRRMLFSRFRVALNGAKLSAEIWGEALDVARHQPAVEIKGATYTDLRVARSDAGTWTAQCIVDV